MPVATPWLVPRSCLSNSLYLLRSLRLWPLSFAVRFCLTQGFVFCHKKLSFTVRLSVCRDTLSFAVRLGLLPWHCLRIFCDTFSFAVTRVRAVFCRLCLLLWHFVFSRETCLLPWQFWGHCIPLAVDQNTNYRQLAKTRKAGYVCEIKQ